MSKDEKTYPMLSTSNWWKIREKFQTSLPTKVTTTYLVSLLDLKDGNSATSNVLSPMKTLGLVDEDGEPTEIARTWRLDDSYEEACNEMLERVYPSELLELLPEKDIDKSVAQTWFMKDGVGKNAAQKMTRLFALLKEADLSKKTTKPTSAKSQKGKSNQRASKSPSTKEPSEKIGIDSPSLSSAQAHKSTGLEPNLHIDLQIHISPESTPEQIEAIFSSMAKHLYKTNGM